MSKFCTYCGNEIHENAVVCVKCGCAVPQGYNQNNSQSYDKSSHSSNNIVSIISKRIETNGIIWIVIGAVQILLGIFADWFVLIVGILNLISAIQDINYSKSFPLHPVGIVEKMKPLTMPIITLVYNLIIGGVIGVIGSIYYFVAVRGYVMENQTAFLEIENKQNINSSDEQNNKNP